MDGSVEDRENISVELEYAKETLSARMRVLGYLLRSLNVLG